MSASQDKGATLNVAIAEFNALRGEIRDRASAAFLVLNINITATTAVMGMVLSGKADPMVLLILPLFSPALGMLFVDHSHNIRNLGDYINLRLRPLAVAAAGEPRLLAYEEFVRQYEQDKLRRFLPLGLPLSVLFVAVPFGVLAFLSARIEHLWVWALWGVGLLMAAAFSVLWLSFLLAPYRGGRKGEGE